MKKFKGKTWTLERIHACPVCGAEPLLRKNAGKDFQVWCSCGCKTGWSTKIQCVIDWYNLIMAIEGRKNERVSQE